MSLASIRSAVSSVALRIKGYPSRIVAAVLRTRADAIRENPAMAGNGLIDRLVKSGLYHRAVARGDLDHLAWYHRQFWQGERAAPYFADDGRDNPKPLLVKQFKLDDRLAEFLDAHPDLANYLCEIGSGDGRTLDYLRKRFPNLNQYIGLDVSSRQNERNRELYNDTDIRFVTGDANEWIRDHARPQTLYITSGGVLEYFSQRELMVMLSGIAKRAAPAIIAVIEPLDDNHDLMAENTSFFYGDERSFSHNYPHIFQQAGYEISFCTEHHATGYRWICLLAVTIDKAM